MSWIKLNIIENLNFNFTLSFNYYDKPEDTSRQSSNTEKDNIKYYSLTIGESYWWRSLSEGEKNRLRELRKDSRYIFPPDFDFIDCF